MFGTIPVSSSFTNFFLTIQQYSHITLIQIPPEFVYLSYVSVYHLLKFFLQRRLWKTHHVNSNPQIVRQQGVRVCTYLTYLSAQCLTQCLQVLKKTTYCFNRLQLLASNPKEINKNV